MVRVQRKVLQEWHRTLGTELYKTIACRFSRYEGFNTDCVGRANSREQKKDRDGCYMNARYGGFPQGTLVDWETRGPPMGWPGWDLFLRRMTWNLSRRHLTSRLRERRGERDFTRTDRRTVPNPPPKPEPGEQTSCSGQCGRCSRGALVTVGPRAMQLPHPGITAIGGAEIEMHMIDRKLGGRRDLCFLEAKSRT